jgi:hypothetical protein
MGVSTSEVGYASATTGRETTKSMTDMWWHWIKKIYYLLLFSLALQPSAVEPQPARSQHTSKARNYSNSICAKPPEDGRVMPETCKGIDS